LDKETNHTSYTHPSSGIDHREKELFREVATGSETAFAELFHIYSPRLEPVIHSLTRTESATKDIVQDVFLKLWVIREQLPEIESPDRWIFRMAFNRSFTWLKQKKSRERRLQKLATTQDSPEYTIEPDFREAAEQESFFRETAALVRRAVDQLPAQSKRIYNMRETGMKNTEIADQLGISEQTVKNTMSHSFRVIRSFLGEKGIELPVLIIALLFS
jgi:RNA polymerase sigma-70 factor (family 1)